MRESRNGLARVVAAGVVSALFSGLMTFTLLWFTAVASRPSRAEVAEMIRIESPYLADRNLLRDQMEQANRAIDRLHAQVSALQTQVTRVETKLDLLRIVGTQASEAR